MSWVLWGALTLAAPFPDEMDMLRTSGVRPKMNVILDSSCSMKNGRQWTGCSWFADTYTGGNRKLNKNQVMRAVLVGCREKGDGILDRWVDRIDIAIHSFEGLEADFGTDIDTMRDAVAAVLWPTGSTPLSRALDQGGEFLDARANDDNTERCTPFFQLLLSDGDPYGSHAWLEQGCTAPVATRNVHPKQPWFASDYLYASSEDLICSVSGDQTIATHTLGFGPAGSFNPTYLQRIADYGGGSYFYASSVPELVAAFDTIMSKVAAAGQAFAQVSIGQDTYFADRRAYIASLSPALRGAWSGNLRKICVLPEVLESGLYDITDKSCLLHSDDGDVLLTNPRLVDQWTGLELAGTELGGAGEILTQRLAGPMDATAWDRRRLVTWRPGEAGWVEVHPDTWGDADAWVSGCERYQLINFLHGYTWDADCDTGYPLEAREWALGDAIHASPLELRYGDCETGTAAGKDGCLVLFAANDGQLHIFDAATGEETSAIVPAELWKPGGFANSALSQMNDQPGVRYSHRYYIDGAIRSAHDDVDGDGRIDATEKAWVIFSLGRGGRAYYALDVSQMADGIVDDDVKIYPIVPTVGTSFRKMSDTWMPPVLSDIRIGTDDYSTLVFAGGHYAQMSITDRTDVAPDLGLDDDDDENEDEDEDEDDEERSIKCDDFEDENNLDRGSLCDDFSTRHCAGWWRWWAGSPCYDSAGLPLDIASPPLTISEDGLIPKAMRFELKRLDLEEGDVLRFEDGNGHLLAELTSESDRDDSPWLYASRVVVRLVTDGIDKEGEGYEIKKIHWIGQSATVETDPALEPEPVLGESHLPTVFLVDLERFNGPSPIAFADAVGDEGIVLEVTAECAEGADHCLDASEAPDLADLICPISGEITPYVQLGRATAFYFGDECAQIWKIFTPNQGVTWTAKRLAKLNDGPVAYDKDHRKIFRSFDLVDSMCPGQLVVGIYFGTGNLQRPLATDELEDPEATDGYELVGVLWDFPELPPSVGPEDFVDATEVAEIDPEAAFASGAVGWVLRLDEHERMLKAPLVVDGVAYYRTFQVDLAPTACEAGTGFDRIYALDNCDAKAAASDGDRRMWSMASSGGAELLLITPSNGVPFVTHGDATTSQRASLKDNDRGRPDVMFWRWIP